MLLNSINRVVSLTFSYVVLFIIIPYKKKGYVTCSGKTDGMGAQVLAIYSAMLYAKANKIKYCHTSLKSVEHNENNIEHFSNVIETYFSLAQGEQRIENLLPTYTVICLNHFTWKGFYNTLLYLFSKKTIFIFQRAHFHTYGNRNANQYLLIKDKIRTDFFTQPKLKINTPKNKLFIVVHIRRGDVSIHKNKDRYTGNNIVEAKLKSLILALDTLNIAYEICIVSQGDIADFGNLSKIATLNINKSVFDDFALMVQADILFTAKSALSYTAALLSNGIIIYEPFYHKNLKNWVVYEADVFKQTKFITAINRYYLAKQLS